MKVAVIPARGGSKRIPRKNIREFCGKPIIAYSIGAAIESRVFDRIIVSTDDSEIAKVARTYGAETPFMRPSLLSDDHTGTNAVVKHAIEWLAEHGTRPEHACCIYATAPFVQAKHLRAGLELLKAKGKSFAFSVTSFPFPIQRSVRLLSDGSIEAMQPEHMNTRSQDLEEAFHDAGQFYWGRSEAFVNAVPLFTPSSVGVVLPRHLVQDIDTPEDWVRAEYMYKALRLAGELST